MFDVVVVGSINQDLAVFTPAHPAPGETVLGREHRWFSGGKGANQAVAAARLSSRTALVGCVGADQHGKDLVEEISLERVDVSCVTVDEAEPTGLAVITIDDQAENSIVVSPGANMKLSPPRVARCSEPLRHASVVLAQLEIPIDSVIESATAAAGTFCLNPAPARPIPRELMDRVDVLVPNLGELATLASVDRPRDRSEIVAAVRNLGGPHSVVVTLGDRGAMVFREDEVTDLPPTKVEAVDTTGAGDAFCGALASELARGEDLVDAARWATLAGALATTRSGARDAMPTREEMEQHK